MENEPLRAEKYYRDALQFLELKDAENPKCAELHQLIIEALRADANKSQQF